MNPPQDETFAQRVRRCTGMFIGGVNPRGLACMIDQLVDDLLAIPRAQIGRVATCLLPQGEIVVEIEGTIPGVSVEHFSPDAPNSQIVQSRWDFLALPILAALSRRLEVCGVQDGKRWTQRLAAGVPVEPPYRETNAEPNFLRLQFVPDEEIFKEHRVSYLALCGRFQEMAAFHPATIFRLEDRTGPSCVREFHYVNGLVSFMEELEHDWFGMPDYGRMWVLRHVEGPDSAQAVIYERGVGGCIIHSFVNGRRSRDGGTHVKGFEQAYLETLASKAGKGRRRFNWREAPLDGLTVLLAVNLVEAAWDWATKDRLTGDHPKQLVAHMVRTELPRLWTAEKT